MQIDLQQDGLDLCAAGPLWLATSRLKTGAIGESVRIGITRNVACKLRFYERGNPCVVIQRGYASSRRSQINLDIARWSRTADQHVARGWWLEWIRLILDSSPDQCALAGMTDPCAARPLYGDVARFRKFQQTGKP